MSNTSFAHVSVNVYKSYRNPLYLYTLQCDLIWATSLSDPLSPFRTKPNHIRMADFLVVAADVIARSRRYSSNWNPPFGLIWLGPRDDNMLFCVSGQRDTECKTMEKSKREQRWALRSNMPDLAGAPVTHKQTRAELNVWKWMQAAMNGDDHYCSNQGLHVHARLHGGHSSWGHSGKVPVLT